ncbi:hypothetical protein [Chlamydia buteonis]|uniref:Uncharacterized protein n=1 Tax=Chlamydia buteonis TaxID=2494525 RepID=A0ABX8LG90_9CHLA|nr:hypothetical protein [Chlamydia buteonis]QXE26996.1 hypothetical protein HBN95_02385 [Chlamydia buteonis]QXE28062.1 hypothetical protein JJJ19_00760 [Chlamydia buteonis]
MDLLTDSPKLLVALKDLITGQMSFLGIFRVKYLELFSSVSMQDYLKLEVGMLQASCSVWKRNTDEIAIVDKVLATQSLSKSIGNSSCVIWIWV